MQIVIAAGIAGAWHAELLPRIGGQKIALHHAVFHHIARNCRDTLGIKRPAGEATANGRIFTNRDDIGKHRFANTVLQKTRFAIQRAATHRTHKAANQTRCDRCFEQYRHLATGNFLCIQPRNGALACATANRFGRFQTVFVARHRVPVIALHALFGRGDHGAACAMPCRGIATDKTRRIGVDEIRLISRYRCAFRIIDALVDGKRRCLHALAEFNRIVDREFPRVIKAEVRERWLREPPGIGEPGKFIGGRIFGNRQRRLDGALDRFTRNIGGRCIAAVLPQIDSDA